MLASLSQTDLCREVAEKEQFVKRNFDLTVFKVIIFYSKSLVYNLNFLSYCCISFNGDRF